MSKIPSELKYTKSHEWLKDEGDGTYLLGITDHAQDQLGDMVYVELQEPGANIDANGECAVVESVKAASEVYMPVSAEVIAVNEALADQPETINQDAYGQGWLMKIKPANTSDVQTLLDAEAYSSFLDSEAH